MPRNHPFFAKRVALVVSPPGLQIPRVASLSASGAASADGAGKTVSISKNTWPCHLFSGHSEAHPGRK
jgi:hypothetical protein